MESVFPVHFPSTLHSALLVGSGSPWASWCIIGGFWFTLAQALIQLKLVLQLLGLFDNSSGNISPKNIYKLPEEQEKNLSNHGDQCFLSPQNLWF
jgi:hypothetical protein